MMMMIVCTSWRAVMDYVAVLRRGHRNLNMLASAGSQELWTGSPEGSQLWTGSSEGFSFVCYKHQAQPKWSKRMWPWFLSSNQSNKPTHVVFVVLFSWCIVSNVEVCLRCLAAWLVGWLGNRAARQPHRVSLPRPQLPAYICTGHCNLRMYAYLQ